MPQYAAAQQVSPTAWSKMWTAPELRTPPGEWLSQAHEEWVLLLKGAAILTLEGEAPLMLGPGDHVLIPADLRHRVDWTDPRAPTVWLALHIG